MATFFNQATLTYSNGSVDSNIVTGELIEALSVSKTPNADSYLAGEEIAYAVGIVNSSSSQSPTLTVTDDLGAYQFGGGTVYPLDYVEGSVRLLINGVPAPSPTVTDTEPLTVTGFNIPAGGNAVLIYSATVNGFASPEAGGTVTNTVTVIGAGVGSGLTASATLPSRGGPILGIVKDITPDRVTANSPITYTITVTNSGNEAADATDDIVVSDAFDPVLTITSVTLNGTPLTEGSDYTYNTATGLFTTARGLITVPAATYTVDETTGEYTVTPGRAVLTVNGTV